MAGQSVGLIDREQSLQEIMEELISEANDELHTIKKRLKAPS